jgi:hypothetical protein
MRRQGARRIDQHTPAPPEVNVSVMRGTWVSHTRGPRNYNQLTDARRLAFSDPLPVLASYNPRRSPAAAARGTAVRVRRPIAGGVAYMML